MRVKMNAAEGYLLIEELLSNPRQFEEEPRGYELLQFYLKGKLPTASLVDLLRHESPIVQRTASFIASELGYKARPIIEELVPLVASTDRHIANYAMEVLTVCATNEHGEKFVHIVRMLGCPDEALRWCATRLVVNATTAQLEAAKGALDTTNLQDTTHSIGLAVLIAGNRLQLQAAADMMRSEVSIIRRYGAIAILRLQIDDPSIHPDPELLDDPSIRELFCEVE